MNQNNRPGGDDNWDFYSVTNVNTENRRTGNHGSRKAPPRKKVKRYGKGYVAFMNLFLSFLLIVSILGTGVSALALYGDFSESGDAKVDMSSIAKSESEDVVYFLVAGMDAGESLTDIMMVVCFDIKANTANVMQIPRDTFIGSDVPSGKMNAVYGLAPREEGQSNINAMLRRINDYFGLPVDHYITVNLSAFRDIVDAVGGVDVYVPSNIYNAFNSKKERYTFEEGMHHMDGSQAEAFVRHRKSYSMGDLGRVQAQRNFYAAFIKKCLDMSYTQMATAAKDVYDDISTDMKLVDILAYAKLAQKLSVEKINFHAVPGQSGTYSVNGGQALSYYSIHKQDYVDLINRYFMPYSDPITVDSLAIQELHTTYYNNVIEDTTGLGKYLNEEVPEEVVDEMMNETEDYQ